MILYQLSEPSKFPQLWYPFMARNAEYLAANSFNRYNIKINDVVYTEWNDEFKKAFLWSQLQND